MTPATWVQWTDKTKQEQVIAEFQKPLGPVGDKSSPVAFLSSSRCS